MKLQTKLLLLILPVAFLFVYFMMSLSRNTVDTVLDQEVVRSARARLADLAVVVVPGLKAESETQLLPLLQISLQQTVGAQYAMVLDPQGRVIAHTNVSEKGKIYNDLRTQEALHASAMSQYLFNLKDSEVMDISMPVKELTAATDENFLLEGKLPDTSGKRLGTLRLGVSLTDNNVTSDRISRQIGFIGTGIVGGLVIFFLLVLYRKVLLPVHALVQANEQLSQGAYGITVPIHSTDELGILAKSFNHMSQALNSTTVSKDFMSSIFSNMFDPLLVLSMDTHIRTVNQATLSLLGYTESELVQQPVEILIFEKDRLFTGSDNRTLVGEGLVRNLEINFLAKSGGKIPVLFSSTVLKNKSGTAEGIIVMAKDISERKKLENQILQSGKLSAVGQLAGGVAHEINNPLGVIMGFAQGVLRRIQPGDPLEMPLKSIEREAIRCKNLVQDLLTFSRTSKVEREPMELNAALNGALSLVQAQARIGNIEVRKELAPQLPRMLGNPNQVQQVIVNLANNALDAMGKDGTLTFRTCVQQEAGRSWVCLTVSDTGSGIPPEVLPRIYEPFFTTKPIGQGTGLGLGLVHEIVLKHSGTIDVKSRPGATEFCVKFPVRTGQEFYSQGMEEVKGDSHG